MTVHQFPMKPDNRKDHTPEEVLQRVLDGLRSGETSAKTLVITWTEENEDAYAHRYVVGGEGGLGETVGLLEITKSMMLE